MQISHWEALQPVCPRCAASGETNAPLYLAEILKQGVEERIDEGIIYCTIDDCRQEYPIIDGVPILVPNVREYVAAYAQQILQRCDLSSTVESLIGDCIGPDEPFNLSRFYLSSYAHDGYGEFATDEAVPDYSVTRLLEDCLTLAHQPIAGPILDLGCGTGRSTLTAAARTTGLLLGLDMNFSFMQFAQGILSGTQTTYARRRTGLVYERVPISVPKLQTSRIDFWVCDAQALPFAQATAGSAFGLNLLDSVHSPISLLDEIGRVLVTGGQCVLATPFDWSASATPAASWIGGHSQRSSFMGDPVKVLRNLFPRSCTDGVLKIVSERDDLLWETTRSQRSVTRYCEYAIGLAKEVQGASD